MATAKTGKRVTVRSAEELGRALGLSVADTAEMEFRSDLTVALVTIIEAGSLTHAEIAKRAGTSRTRVTAIANGNTQGVSTDVLIRVLAATGHRAEVGCGGRCIYFALSPNRGYAGSRDSKESCRWVRLNR